MRTSLYPFLYGYRTFVKEAIVIAREKTFNLAAFRLEFEGHKKGKVLIFDIQ